jgi:hypothetical protein
MTVSSYLLDDARYPHGTRARYVRGCRCADCRAANTGYAAKRAALVKGLAAGIHGAATVMKPHGDLVRRYKRACIGVGQPCPTSAYLRKDSTGDVCASCRARVAWNGLVDASPARAHLAQLSSVGVGYKSVADAASVAVSVVAKIRTGERTQVRAETARRILAVDAQAIADHGLVDAAETWRLLRALIADGHRKYKLAAALGQSAKTPAIQFRGGKVLAKTALRVRKLHDALMAESDDVVDIDDSPKAHLLRAIRFFDWVSAEDLAGALDVESDDRNTWTQMLGRMVQAGEVERSARRVEGAYLYRRASS